jgi:riboflavin-specific deaminase-like protein
MRASSDASAATDAPYLKMRASIDRWLEDLSTGRLAASGRPVVTLTYAQSLDGSIAAAPGKGLPLSGPESMRLTHRLRAAHQAILVGIGTVLADDPQLTVRLVDGRSPQPVVLDSALRTPPGSRLMQRGDARPWIFTTAQSASSPQAQILVGAGARVFAISRGAEHLDLSALLVELFQQGVTSLMVEGGARVLRAFLRAGLFDYALVTIAPVWVGGYPLLDGGFPGAEYPAIADPLVAAYGTDLVVFGRRGERRYTG